MTTFQRVKNRAIEGFNEQPPEDITPPWETAALIVCGALAIFVIGIGGL